MSDKQDQAATAGGRHCPDCHTPVSVRAQAREGRCAVCRPRRRHSTPRVPQDRIDHALLASHR